MTRSDGRPAWMAQGQAQVNAKLDQIVTASDRKMANDLRLWSERPRPALTDNEEARRKERGLVKKQEWELESALQQAEQNNLEPLRKLYPRLTRFINPPRLKRGEHFKKKPPTDHLTPHCRLEEALFELSRARAFLQSFYRKTGCPRGQLTAEQILAERWDLTENEIRKRRISRSRLKQDRQANFVRSK